MATLTIPDFPAQLDWLNSPPLSFERELRHKIVVLDFWTFCCINCMHVLPELAELEKKYADQPVVFIGVHSPKFENEKSTENIRQAILRYGIRHPVVNDPSMELWRELGAHGWPTLVVIGPEGTFLKAFSGEGHTHAIDACIQAALRYFDPEQLDPTPLPQTPEPLPHSQLFFPGKLAVADRLFISDSNHHRILITDLEGKIQDVIGSGTLGMVDGSFAKACFHHPQGVAYAHNQLFVADTENHAIRRIDLERKQVTTLAGTGVQGLDRVGGKVGRAQPLNSPWDVATWDDRLLIAMAGSHQIWVHELASGASYAINGSGAEARGDSDDPDRAAWAQPSGLARVGETLYVADSESSSIRMLNLRRGVVSTLVGGDPTNPRNLFAFGDRDGTAYHAQLQHPLGLAWLPSRKRLVIADSYNHRLKLLDPINQTLTSWVGEGEPGYVDGDPHFARFSEPSGVAIDPSKERVYIADTNNHAIRFVDAHTGCVETLEITE